MSDENKHTVEIDGIEYLKGFEPPNYRRIVLTKNYVGKRRSEIINRLDKDYTEIGFRTRDFVEVLVWGVLLGCIVVVLASLFLVAL
jgi:hypothetical protein